MTILTGQRVTDISSGYRATRADTLRAAHPGARPVLDLGGHDRGAPPAGAGRRGTGHLPDPTRAATRRSRSRSATPGTSPRRSSRPGCASGGDLAGQPRVGLEEREVRLQALAVGAFGQAGQQVRRHGLAADALAVGDPLAGADGLLDRCRRPSRTPRGPGCTAAPRRERPGPRAPTRAGRPARGRPRARPGRPAPPERGRTAAASSGSRQRHAELLEPLGRGDRVDDRLRPRAHEQDRRSGELDQVRGDVPAALGCTPPMPPVAPTGMPARCAAQIVLETVVAPSPPEASANGRSRRATFAARPGSANALQLVRRQADDRPRLAPRRSTRGRRRRPGPPRSSARRTRGCGAAEAPGTRRSSRARRRRRPPRARPRPRSEPGRRSPAPPRRWRFGLGRPGSFGPRLEARRDPRAGAARRVRARRPANGPPRATRATRR